MSLVQRSRDFEPVLKLAQSPLKDTQAIHTLFSYAAKFQSQVPEFIINNYSEPQDLILDPFGGGGTTAAAAKNLGRNFSHYDLNPLSCLIALAKTCHYKDEDHKKLDLTSVKHKFIVNNKILTFEESNLLEDPITTVIEKIWSQIICLKKEENSLAPLLAVLLIKFIKQCGRRDSSYRRKRPLENHLNWFKNETSRYFKDLSEDLSEDLIEGLSQDFQATEYAQKNHQEKKIICASNHALNLKDNSVDLIITSPPYPGVDIEYNEIQLQRPDLHRCFRSDIGVRIANLFFAGNPEKRSLCDGGLKGFRNYFNNAERSLIEMRRVLKPTSLAFIYCGFKTEIDQKRYETLLIDTGFKILKRADVKLSDDRVASSRSTHHKRQTKMMKQDFLFVCV